MTRITSPVELYAHAIAIEREAAERYAELAQRMQDEGRDALAAVFASLAASEAGHLEVLLRRTEGVALPALAPGAYQWLDEGAPETAARELIFRLLTPQQALRIALAAEQRAQAFFEGVFMTARDPALCMLAQRMAAEEQAHGVLLEQLLDQTPEPSLERVLLL